jgi:hypothetical protein
MIIMVKERTADASLYTKYRRQAVNAKITLNDGGSQTPLASRVSNISQSPYGSVIPISFQFRFGGRSGNEYVTLDNVLLSIASGTTRNLILNFVLSRALVLPVGVQLYRNTSASTTGGTLIASSTVPPAFTANNMYPFYHYYTKATLNSEYVSNVVNTLSPLGTAFAGNYSDAYGGDGGQANFAQIKNPEAITFNDSKTILYIGDNTGRLRQVNMATNVITTIIGNGSADSTASILAGAAGTSVGIATPKRLAYSEPFVLIVHGSTLLRAYNTSAATASFNGVSVSAGHVRTVTTIASSGLWGIATDSNGDAFVSDVGTSRIRKINKSSAGNSVVAGNGSVGYAGDGGVATSANFRNPTGCDMDKARNVLYVSDRDNIVIRAINLNATGSVNVAGVSIAAGNINRVAGTANQFTARGVAAVGDGGPARSARFTGLSTTESDMWTCSVDPLGNIYIGDANVLRRVDVETGIITGVTGYPTTVLTENTPAYNRSSLSTMQCAFGLDNSIYVASYGSNYVQRIY